MSTLSKRLAAAMAGSAVLMLAAPVVAGATPAQHTESAASSAAAAPNDPYVGDRGAFHHNKDPRQGTIQVAVRVEWATVNGRFLYRGTAKITKVSKAVRIQIDRVTFESLEMSPGGAAQNTNAVNSGAQAAITLSTPWVDATDFEPNCCNAAAGYRASVEYSTRWSDSTVTRGVFSASAGVNYNYAFPLRPVYTGTEKVAASTVLNHYGNPARGSVKLDAGMRVYKGAIQPYATIKKISNTARVQIDGVEALGYSALADETPRPENSLRTWPYNAIPRSSGTGASASLSTPITSIKPNVDPYIPENNYSFRVAVYYSIRWIDGTLSTGTYLTPLGNNSAAFPDAQGF